MGISPPSGVSESCIVLTAPQEASVVMVVKRAELKMPNGFPCPPYCHRRIDAESGDVRIAGGLEMPAEKSATEEDHKHRCPDRPAVALVLHHAAQIVK